jgi:hypothetical protein
VHAPVSLGDGPDVHERVVGYLERHTGTPWADQLALVVAVMTAGRRDVSTVCRVVQILHARFKLLLPALGLTTMADWRADQHLLAYLRGEVLPEDRQRVRTAFWRAYSTATRQVARWLATLPDPERDRYHSFVLPVARPDHVEGLVKAAEVQREQRETRKAETDAVVPQFAAIRSEAHLRHNRCAIG